MGVGDGVGDDDTSDYGVHSDSAIGDLFPLPESSGDDETLEGIRDRQEIY